MLIKVGIFLFVVAYATGSAVRIDHLPKIHRKHLTTNPPGLMESTTGHKTQHPIPNRKIRSPDEASKEALKSHINIDQKILLKHSTTKPPPDQIQWIALQQKYIQVPKIESLNSASASGIKIASLPKVHSKYSTTNLPPVEVEWIEPKTKHVPIRKIRSSGKGSAGINISHNDKSGTTGSINAQQNIFSSSDGKTRIDAYGSVSKNVDHGNSNQNIGLSLNDGSAGININHNDKSGTSGTISAHQNIYSSPDGNTNVDVAAGVSKNFDHGNSDQNIGLSVSHKF